MRRISSRTGALLAVAVAAACGPDSGPEGAAEPEAPAGPAEPGTVVVPDGFRAEVFTEAVTEPRRLRVGPDGMLYAALSRPGKVVRLDPDDPEAPPEDVLTGLQLPYGLVFHDGDLWVGEGDQVVRFPGPDFAQEQGEVVVPDLPTGGHWTRDIAFGPDGMLYVSIGSSCNLCEEEDPRRAAVVRYAPDGSGETVVAHGIRNSAGLAFHPGTGVLWASQNERDQLGDDLPPEEINLLSDGEDFGWPYCYGQRIPNPEYDDRERCAGTTPPALEMQAHSAPLGMSFYDGGQFPQEYRGDLFLAFHGSWNRSERTGYKVVRVRVRDGRPVGYEDFATGWLDDAGEVHGRPVDVAVGPDGSLFVSDDGPVGRIWRITWTDGRGR